MPLFILFFLISMSAFSKTHVLLLDPGNSPRGNYIAYYNAVRRGYEVARSSGFETKVIAKNGTWIITDNGVKLSTIAYTKEGKESKDPNSEEIPSYPPLERKAVDANDIVKTIKSFEAKDNDSVLIFITSHGFAPTKPGDPSTATIAGWYNNFTYVELAEALDKLPKNIKIKIASTICYSGGIHHIARTLSNVCTVATVGYSTFSLSNPFESDFSKEFWEQLKEKGKTTSFADMSIAGLRKDKYNINMGNLSSWDYVDFVLNRGDHEKNERNVHMLQYRFGHLLTHYIQNSTSVFPPAEKMHVQNSTQECKTGCDSDSILSVEELDDLSKILERIETKSLEQSLRDKANTLPAQTQSIFHDVIEDMKENGKKYAQIDSDYDRQYKDLKKDWDTYLKKRWDRDQHKFEPGSKDWKNEADNKRAQFQSDMDALQKKAKSDLSRYAFNRQMLDRLDRLDEFSRVATDKQKQKFMQLLNCEWEPI